jgi:hypothetical protein
VNDNQNPKHRDSLLRAADSIIELLEAAFEHGGEGLRITILTPHSVPVAAALANRGKRYFEALLLLCKRGHAMEAQSLLRTMVQDVIDLRYLATDPETLVEEWAKHADRRRYCVWERIKRENPGAEKPPDMDEIERWVLEERKEAKRKAKEKGSKNWKAFVPHQRWTVKTIEQAAWAADESGKWGDTVATAYGLYRNLSEPAHGSAVGASDYVQSQNGLLVFRTPDDFMLIPVLRLGLSFIVWHFEALTYLGVQIDLDQFKPVFERKDLMWLAEKRQL